MENEGSAFDESPNVSVHKIISYHSTSSDGASLSNASNLQTVVVSIVNPQGTVTTVTNNPTQIDESFSSDNYIHENCDETMFRPVVTVMSDPTKQRHHDHSLNEEDASQPIEMPSHLIVPVIDEKVLEQRKKDREFQQIEKVRKQQEAVRAQEIQREEAEKARQDKLDEAERIRIADEEKAEKAREAERARKAKQDEDERKKFEMLKKIDEEEQAPIMQKKGKKGQKQRKISEPEKKPTMKEPTPPKILAEPPKVVTETPKIVAEPPKVVIEPLKIVAESHKVFAEKEKSPEVVEKSLIESAMDIELREEFPDFNPAATPTVEVQLPAVVVKEVKLAPEPPVEKSAEPDFFAPKAISFVEMMQAMKSEEKLVKTAEVVPEKKLPRAESEPKVVAKRIPADLFPELGEPKPVEKIEPVKVELPAKKTKKGKKYPAKQPEKLAQMVLDDFPALSFQSKQKPLPLDDHRAADKEAIMKISMHETIGDDEIEIIPHKNTVVIQDSPEKFSSDVEIIEEHFEMPEEPAEVKMQSFIKNEDFYDLDDDLPPLEPLESFDGNFEPLSFDQAPLEKEEDSVDEQKACMKKKMSELLKDTNMVFAMCSSLKEILDDDDSKSMESSQIQTSNSSSMTTNTTTATFASASSNQTGEGQDSDYKSLEFDMDENAPTDAAAEAEFKVPAKLDDDQEDISSFEATSSETDDSSKRSNSTAPKFKREDDEELRPLLQTSITSLSSPISTNETTTEANDTSTLPETNQKSPSSSQAISNNGNGNKRKNKKKRR